MKRTLPSLKHAFVVIFIFVLNIINAQCFEKISSGKQHSIAIKDDGTLWSWGYNFNGQLGIDGIQASSTPKQIGTANTWVNISTGWWFSAAIKSDGTLWMWGDNQSGVLGDGTDGIFNQRNVPYQVGTDTNWKYVSAGAGHVLAIKTNGTLWSWGTNNRGELGIGDANPRNIPVQVGTDNSWKSAHGGINTSIGIKNDGSLWSWGENGKGQLGIGVNIGIDGSPRITPQRVGEDNNWSYASSGDHTLALKTDGSLWAWGNNGVGELGDGTTINRSAPVKIGTSNWKAISAGDIHSLAVKTDGTLWAWGYNFNYQLGNGTNVESIVPTQIGTATNFKYVSAGGDEFSIAVDENSSRWVAGANGRGQLGDGTPSLRRFFVEVTCVSLGIDDMANVNNAKVFPNPFKESLKIKGLNTIYSAQLFDVSGKLILEEKNINSENYTLQTDMISKGIYILTLDTKAGRNNIKVVK